MLLHIGAVIYARLQVFWCVMTWWHYTVAQDARVHICMLL